MKEISIDQINGIRIGQTENTEAGTGCTVLLKEDGMPAGIDIRGGGPASRDTHLLDPTTAAGVVHAVVLGGGSAFGLDAAGGVQQYLEEHDIGFEVVVTKVPLVVQSDIFDLTVGNKAVRPDHAMGYEAVRRAMEDPNYKDGNYGAGCGATVGKIAGMERSVKTGIGSYAIQIGALQVGAIVVLNALGDVYDWKTGRKAAGVINEDRTGFADTVEIMQQSIDVVENRFAAGAPDDITGSTEAGTGSAAASAGPTTNTTIAAVITNAAFTKSQLCKIASMAHNGYGRSIRPVHTTADGDSIYALSTGNVSADQDLVGTLAADVISEAILRAVSSAESAYGITAARDLDFTE